jgi:hypothetical protein
MKVTLMQSKKSPILLLLMAILSWTILGQAQDNPSAAERLEDLKLQLIEVKAREEGTKLQAQELDEALKPENIERALAGVGSTRPEELREQRRRELTIQRTEVTSQLALLEAQRSRLEAAISTAEVQAYHESAAGFPEAQNQLTGLSTRWIVIFGVIGVLAIGVFVLGYRKLRVSRQPGS